MKTRILALVLLPISLVACKSGGPKVDLCFGFAGASICVNVAPGETVAAVADTVTDAVTGAAEAVAPAKPAAPLAAPAK